MGQNSFRIFWGKLEICHLVRGNEIWNSFSKQCFLDCGAEAPSLMQCVSSGLLMAMELATCTTGKEASVLKGLWLSCAHPNNTLFREGLACIIHNVRQLPLSQRLRYKDAPEVPSSFHLPHSQWSHKGTISPPFLTQCFHKSIMARQEAIKWGSIIIINTNFILFICVVSMTGKLWI